MRAYDLYLFFSIIIVGIILAAIPIALLQVAIKHYEGIIALLLILIAQIRWSKETE